MADIRHQVSPSLQKACNACAKAKRRCDKLCPCSRCQADGIVCSYRNLPWLSESKRGATNVPIKRRERQLIVAFSKEFNQYEHINREETLHLPTPSSLSRAIRPSPPPLLRNLEATDMNMLRTLLRDLPAACVCDSTIAGVSSDLLLNPVLFGKQMETALFSTPPLIRLLRSTQLLLAVQVQTIFHHDSRIRGYAQKQQQRLTQLSHRLWLEAPTSLPRSMTAHSAWKLGESIRRTIIASHLLTAVIRAMNTAIVQYEPFLASLPFDRRIALWDMEDNDPWLAYIDAKQIPLVSLQEWLEGGGNGHVIAASVIQRIMLILYRPWTHREIDFRELG
jgi:hypothetical protein